MTSEDHAAGATATSGGDVLLEEIYGRVVNVHAALAEATTVDRELHHWCEGQLDELVTLLEQALPEEEAPAN